MHKIHYLLIITSLLLFNSCVSKKKFIEMQSDRDKYKSQTNELLGENGKLKKDLNQAETEFETMKNELHASTAVKDDLIDELSQKVTSLETNTSNLEKRLSNTMNMFQKEQFTATQKNSSIASLELQIEQLKRDTISLNYSMKLARARMDKLKEEIDLKTDRINDRNIQIGDLRSQIKVKEANYTSLQKKLDEQKANLASVGSSFIELRKELLRAKTSGQPIDPNSNGTISKISKALGQY